MFNKVHPSTERRAENVKKVKKWLQENPNGRKGDCCREVGISYPTLQKITADIEKEKDLKKA